MSLSVRIDELHRAENVKPDTKSVENTRCELRFILHWALFGGRYRLYGLPQYLICEKTLQERVYEVRP